MALPDSSTAGPIDTAAAVFLNALGNDKEIYNGPEHVEYLPSIEGIAYFLTKDWLLGSVKYNGMTYTSESLLYDLAKDQLVVRRPDGFAIELRSDKTVWFALLGHLFVSLGVNNNLNLKPGFYDQLAAGSLTVLVRRQKTYEEKVEETQVRRRFVEGTTYYAVQNNRAYTIRNLRSLLELTGKQSSAIQQQLRHAGIKFKKDPEAAIKAAARYYNQTQP